MLAIIHINVFVFEIHTSGYVIQREWSQWKGYRRKEPDNAFSFWNHVVHLSYFVYNHDVGMETKVQYYISTLSNSIIEWASSGKFCTPVPPPFTSLGTN